MVVMVQRYSVTLVSCEHGITSMPGMEISQKIVESRQESAIGRFRESFPWLETPSHNSLLALPRMDLRGKNLERLL